MKLTDKELLEFLEVWKEGTREGTPSTSYQLAQARYAATTIAPAAVEELLEARAVIEAVRGFISFGEAKNGTHGQILKNRFKEFDAKWGKNE